MNKKGAELLPFSSLKEGQTIEYKESLNTKIDREIVAFANASGGVIYCGVRDNGEVKGINISNRVLSQVQDIARNCDPPIQVTIENIDDKVLAIKVPDGDQKPYQCSAGFFLRIGANAQKLKAQEVKNLFSRSFQHFDVNSNPKAIFAKDLSQPLVEQYFSYAGISQVALERQPQILEALQAIVYSNSERKYLMTNLGVLLFTSDPNRFIPESYITAVKYAGGDKFSIEDRQEIKGSLIEQIEQAISFFKRHIQTRYSFTGDSRRGEKSNYPLVALREAIINAVIHRDYYFQNSPIFCSIFSDRIEIENPGGIIRGLSPEEILGKSVRRNPALADVLYRAGYGEKLGSGLIRIKESLAQNGNPPYEFQAVNFFCMRMFPAVLKAADDTIDDSQRKLLSLLNEASGPLSAAEIANSIGISGTTVTRKVKQLLGKNLIVRLGVGKNTRYSIK
jgi:ATP-dependent DNA helicase RecG